MVPLQSKISTTPLLRESLRRRRFSRLGPPSDKETHDFSQSRLILERWRAFSVSPTLRFRKIASGLRRMLPLVGTRTFCLKASTRFLQGLMDESSSTPLGIQGWQRVVLGTCSRGFLARSQGNLAPKTGYAFWRLERGCTGALRTR